MGEMTPADLAAIREAGRKAIQDIVEFRDRCVAAVVERYRQVGIEPSDQHARAAYDAVEKLIAARTCAYVAEEIGAQYGGSPETRAARDEAALIARMCGGFS